MKFLETISRRINFLINKKINERSFHLKNIDEKICYIKKLLNELQKQNDNILSNMKKLDAELSTIKEETLSSKKDLKIGFDLLRYRQELFFFENYRILSGKQDNIAQDFFKNMQPARGEIRIIQQACCILLKKFDQFCRSENIEYWLSFGALIGAVRSGGAIPWDDDIDVCVMRKDIDKILNLFNDEIVYIKEFYKIDAWNLQHKYRVQFKKDLPVFIDIFIVDFSPLEITTANSLCFSRE